LVGVNDIPLLIQTIVQVPYNHILVVFVFATSHIENLSFLIDNITVLEVKELPPSCVSGLNIEASVASTVCNTP
jgi:hypothetical protein